MKRLLLPLLLIAAVISGCSKGGFSQQSAASHAGVFRYAIAANPTTFDPGKVEDVDTNDLILNMYEGLVAYGEKNTIETRVAESYSSPDQGKTWVFKLRHGVKFHNGREVTADDFAWTLDRNCSPDLASTTARNYLSDIAGVEDVLSGESKHISGVTVVDPYTLQIELDQPRPYFIGKMTYPCAFALCKEAVGNGEIDKPAQTIGCGPFKLDRFLPQQQVNLVAFRDYYGGTPTVARIERPVIKDDSTRLNKFKIGELDLALLDRKDIEGVVADPALKPDLQYQDRPAVYYIGLNQQQCPQLKDAHVRRAIAMAIDRTRIDHDLLGGMPEAHGLVSPGVIGFRPDYKGLPYNPTGAKNELAEAGFPDGKGFPTIELAYREGAGDGQICCEAIQENLKQNLGINVSVRTLEWSALLDARNKDKLQLYYLSWYADYLDPQNFLSFLMMSDAKLNHDGYKNPAFDDLCRQADSTFDEAKRIQLYNRAEDIAVLDAARIPLFYQRDPILISPRVTGVRANLFGQMANTTVKVH